MPCAVVKKALKRRWGVVGLSLSAVGAPLSYRLVVVLAVIEGSFGRRLGVVEASFGPHLLLLLVFHFFDDFPF